MSPSPTRSTRGHGSIRAVDVEVVLRAAGWVLERCAGCACEERFGGSHMLLSRH
jgi:hypothetical protein